MSKREVLSKKQNHSKHKSTTEQKPVSEIKSKFIIYFDWYKLIIDKIFNFFKLKFVPISFSLVFITLILLSLGREYQVNDDIGILFNLRGGFPVSYMSTTLGYFLSFCYLNISPEIPWYGLFLYSIHIISLFLFIKTFFNFEGNLKYWLFPFFFLYISLYSNMIIGVSYNNSALMIGFNGLFAFLIHLNKKRDKLQLITVLLYGIAFSFSFLIRMRALDAVIAYSLPFFIYIFVKHYKFYKSFIIFLVPIILLYIMEIVVVNNLPEDEVNFRKFNVIRGKFHEYPIADNNYRNFDIYNANNWTDEDYRLFRNWFYLNENKYNETTVNNIFKYQKKVEFIKSNFESYLISMKDLFKDYQYEFISIFVLIIISIFINYFSSLILLLYLLYFMIGTSTLILFFRFPERIALPIIISFILLLMILLSKFESRKRLKNNFYHTVFNCIVCITIFVISFKIIGQLFSYSNEIEMRERNSTELLNSLNEVAKNKVILLAPSFHSFETDPLKKVDYKFNFIPSGWTIFSPYFYHSIKEYLGVDKASDVFPKFVNNENNLLCLNPFSNDSLFVRIMKQWYDIDCNFERIGNTTNYDLFTTHRYNDFYKARDYFRKKDFDSSIICLKNQLSVHSNCNVYAMISAGYFYKNDKTNALFYIRKALELDPSDSEALKDYKIILNMK
jgi:hypothetical protein